MVNKLFPVNDYASQYDDYWTSEDRVGEVSGDLEATADQILMSCGVGKTLDIGSGEGELVRALVRRGVDACGLDVSKVVLERASHRMPGRYFCGSVLSIPFEDESFDTVVSTDCMEHLSPDDIAIALQEIYRVTRRNVFLKVATTHDRDGHWHLTVERRAWWETRCFEAGFRKHSTYYRLNPYQSLNHDGWQIIIPLEKIPRSTFSLYPLTVLKDERDLHMDMLRETGSRSDAHVARYHFACGYIRPGDRVLDSACGLGYGSHILKVSTKCRDVRGIDGSEYAINYAQTNYGAEGRSSFITGLLPKYLQEIENDSVDAVVCFETLEHVEDPVGLMREFYRVLTPGGRLIASVPHDWSDDTGQDPNPYHLHVYTFSKFVAELKILFDIEVTMGQTADRVKKQAGSSEWLHKPRSFSDLDPTLCDHFVEAEWLIAVVAKSPLTGATVPYVERAFTSEEQAHAGNTLAFARDYLNPWLIRSIVSIGMRTENPKLRGHWALQVIQNAPMYSADYGAALCIIAYLSLQGLSVMRRVQIIGASNKYLEVKTDKNPNVLRWQVSLTHVIALLFLQDGNRFEAARVLATMNHFNVVSYSPTLLTKYAESNYLLGLLGMADGNVDVARNVWMNALDSIAGDLGKYFSSCNLLNAPGFQLRELSSVVAMAGRLVVAIRYANCSTESPALFHDEVNENLVSKTSWLSSQLDYFQKLSLEKDDSISELQKRSSDLFDGNAWLSSQLDIFRKLSLEKDDSISELQKKATDLFDGNAWLSSQLENFRKLSLEKDDSISELQKRSMELLEGNAWLSSQLDVWKKVVEERDAYILLLQAQVDDLIESKQWFQSQSEAWEAESNKKESELVSSQEKCHVLNAENASLISQSGSWQSAVSERQIELDAKDLLLSQQEGILKRMRSIKLLRLMEPIIRTGLFDGE